MNVHQLTQLCTRLTARLEGGPLTSVQLIDMATLLLFLRRDLTRELIAQQGGWVQPGTVQALDTLLHGIKEHATEASPDELRRSVALALEAAVASLLLLRSDTPARHTDDIP